MNSNLYPVHTLLWVDALAAFEPTATPEWYSKHDSERPVVVRRAQHPEFIPVGIRGSNRSERAAAWVTPASVVRSLSPEQLVQSCPRYDQYSRHPLKQTAALESISQIFARLNIRWGVGGSVGFELATSIITANDNSDLDLIAYLPQMVSDSILAQLWQELSDLPIQMDVQIETEHGAFALREWLQRNGQAVMMKTPYAPILVKDPWQVSF
ncbi:malonate decarboxylase holo-ACP synthase [Vibrio jasicida]|uniref:Malonate decarboxylase holo-ACP synthase n=1 Tax=Vibrio jasicida TaxID=766224 RepID=A0ABW7JEZ4_9VIBR